MIELKDLSTEAKGILKQAIPYYSKKDFYKNEKYLGLYKEFLAATNMVNNPYTFNQFNTAILRYKRWIPLTYKDAEGEEGFDLEVKSLKESQSRDEYRARINGTVFRIKGEILNKEYRNEI